MPLMPPVPIYSDRSFHMALLDSALQLAAERGWAGFSLVEAAWNVKLPVEKLRSYCPAKGNLLLFLNLLADEAVLCCEEEEKKGISLRDKLFDRFMRRFDIFQEYRTGLCAVLHHLPKDPALAALLSAATMDSMHWIADSAGLDRRGLRGLAQLSGLLLIWGQSLHSWEKDTSPDLSETMKILDKALERMERFGLLKEAVSRLGRSGADMEEGFPDFLSETSHRGNSRNDGEGSGELPDHPHNDDRNGDL